MQEHHKRDQLHRNSLSNTYHNTVVNLTWVHELIDSELTHLSNNNNEVTILDAGAGEGLYYEKIKHIPRLNYLGIDNNVGSDSWDFNRVTKADITNLAFIESNSIDIIVCFQVLAHVDDVNAVIKEFSRIIKPGGTIYITSQNAQSLTHIPHDNWRITPFGFAYLTNKHHLALDSISPFHAGDAVSAAKQIQYNISKRRQYYETNILNKLYFLVLNALMHFHIKFFARKWDTQSDFHFNPLAYFVKIKSPKQVETKRNED